MYDQNSMLIALGLFAAMLIANQLGYRLGSKSVADDNSELKSQTTAIQAGIMGLLALLLGFTFNMSLQRYDARSHVVIEETGVISNAVMRATMLPEQFKQPALDLLRLYLHERIELSSIDLSKQDKRRALNVRITDIQKQLFDIATQAAEIDQRPLTSGAFLQALTALVQIEGKRSAMLQLHVPEPVIFLLFTVFITAGGILGYSSGLGRKRPKFPTLIMSALIVLVVFIIIDLDRPKRGIIKVKQESLYDLQQNLSHFAKTS
ncbi:bestrophin-like domain [Paraglaciecola aestuariivivens]